MKRTGSKRLPTGQDWKAAQAEENWGVFLIGLKDAKGKAAKLPVSRRGHPLAGGANAAMVLTYSQAVDAQQSLTVGIDAVAEHIEQLNVEMRKKGKKPFPLPVAFCLGYMARDGSALVIHDFDECRDPETGVILPEIAEAMGETYAEVSSSGTGIHELTKRIPSDAGNRERNAAGRYAGKGMAVALTFEHIEGTPQTINGALRTRKLVDERLSSERKSKISGGKRRLLPEDQHDLASIPSILAELPNPAPDSPTDNTYYFWVDMAHALRAAADEADPQTALQIEQAFYEWSGRWEGGAQEDAPERLWASIKMIKEIGPGSFFFMARALGWSPKGGRPVPSRDIVVWLKRAMAGDADSLQRITRQLVTGLSEDNAAVFTHAIAEIGKISDAEVILATEEQRQAQWVAEQMEGVLNDQ